MSECLNVLGRVNQYCNLSERHEKLSGKALFQSCRILTADFIVFSRKPNQGENF